MAGIMVPKSRIETRQSGGGGGDRPFPAGEWRGTIEDVYPRKEFPDWIDPTANRGYSSAQGQTFSIQLGDIVSLEEDGEDVGARKHFVQFVVKDGTATVEDGPNIPESSWQMKNSAEILGTLAIALGATEEVEYGDKIMIASAPNFLEILEEGGFKGREVGFTTWHDKWTSKTQKNPDGTPKTGTTVVTQTFNKLG